MKLDKHIPESDKVEIPGAYDNAYAKQVVGRTKTHKGHTCFIFNLVTGDISVAEIKKSDVIIGLFGSDGSLKQFVKDDEVVLEENCIPIVALNKKNALRKFEKLSPKLFPDEP